MREAALYVRMSTDKQEHSVENQIQVLTAYALRNGYSIVQTYADEGITGTKAEKRPSFLRMIDDSASGLFDTVLIYDSSRFARNLTESLVYKAELRKNGVTLQSITEPNLDEDSALLVDAVLGASNELYSRKLSKAVTRGMVYYAERGNFPTTPPYGYRKRNGIAHMDEGEARTVRLIYDLFIHTPAWHSVAVQINDLGHRMRHGALWGSRDIKRMLTNPAYIGYVRFRGETYQGSHTPIISQDQWERVQNLIGDKPQKPHMRPENKLNHWLSGIARCAHCGSSMTYTTPQKGLPFFRCHASANGKCRHPNYIPAHTLEGAVMAFLDELMRLDSTAAFDFHEMPMPHGQKDMETVKASIRKAKMRLIRYQEAYAAGIDSLAEYKIHKERCVAELGVLNQALSTKRDASLSPPEKDFQALVIRLQTTGFMALWQQEDATVEEKSHSIRSILESVIIDREENEITAVYYI